MYQNRFIKVKGLYRVCFSELSCDHRDYALPMEARTCRSLSRKKPVCQD